jgi:hypothetical protein
MSPRDKAPSHSDSAILHAIDAVNTADVAVSFMNDNIHPVMAALVELSAFDSMDVAANRVRMGMINNLAKVGRHLVEDAAGSMESDQAEMREKLRQLEGGIQ